MYYPGSLKSILTKFIYIFSIQARDGAPEVGRMGEAKKGGVSAAQTTRARKSSGTESKERKS